MALLEFTLGCKADMVDIGRDTTGPLCGGVLRVGFDLLI